MKKSHNQWLITLWLTAWYGKSAWIYLLLPVSWLFRFFSAVRKFFLVHFIQEKLPVPVIVVGNISVGGTGKTPLIIALVEYLQQQGYKPGVVSRGYGGKADVYPYLLNHQSHAAQSGDEPLLIFNATQCAVCVAPDRTAAAKVLMQQGCNIILSDDGLQHYRLGRALEFAVIDGERLFGNGQCLPVGPLREPISRLDSVDFVIVNNPRSKHLPHFIKHHAMHIQPVAWRQLQTNKQFGFDQIHFKKEIQAIAGIGNPQRFFNTLDSLSLNYVAHEFPDHYHFSAVDLHFSENASVVMTEKDAVKCQDFATADCYALIVRAQLEVSFWQAFQLRLDSLTG